MHSAGLLGSPFQGLLVLIQALKCIAYHNLFYVFHSSNRNLILAPSTYLPWISWITWLKDFPITDWSFTETIWSPAGNNLDYLPEFMKVYERIPLKQWVLSTDVGSEAQVRLKMLAIFSVQMSNWSGLVASLACVNSIKKCTCWQSRPVRRATWGNLTNEHCVHWLRLLCIHIFYMTNSILKTIYPTLLKVERIL